MMLDTAIVSWITVLYVYMFSETETIRLFFPLNVSHFFKKTV